MPFVITPRLYHVWHNLSGRIQIGYATVEGDDDFQGPYLPPLPSEKDLPIAEQTRFQWCLDVSAEKDVAYLSDIFLPGDSCRALSGELYLTCLVMLCNMS